MKSYLILLIVLTLVGCGEDPQLKAMEHLREAQLDQVNYRVNLYQLAADGSYSAKWELEHSQ